MGAATGLFVTLSVSWITSSRKQFQCSYFSVDRRKDTAFELSRTSNPYENMKCSPATCRFQGPGQGSDRKRFFRHPSETLNNARAMAKIFRLSDKIAARKVGSNSKNRTARDPPFRPVVVEACFWSRDKHVII